MRPSTRYLYLTVFVAGMTTLAVEVSAARLLEAVFGTSNIVWANIIGLILIYLTLGYFLGGRWADRSPHPQTFYRLLLWAAFTSGLIPLLARPLLRAAARAFADLEVAVIGGSFLSVLLLFAIPVTLLGCVSPFALRLALWDLRRAGDVAGRVYALSTLGSVIGTFAPVLFLIGAIGTARTFLLFAGLLMAVALLGLARAGGRWWAYLWMPLLLLGSAWLLLRGPLKPPLWGWRPLHEEESAYNYIQVMEAEDGTRYLLLNEGQGVHSVYHPDRLRTFGTWDYFLIAPYFNPPPYPPARVRRVAILGLAAGTIARQITQVYGPLPIVGVEIDPAIVRVGRDYFGMTMPNLQVVVGDARAFLARSPRRYTLVAVDAYRLPYIPWHLTTVEFFRQVRDHLTDDGVVAVNVGHTDTDYRLVAAMVRTLGQVFPSVHVVDLPGTFNALIIATVQPTSPENLAANLDGLQHPFLREVAGEALANLRTVPPDGPIFTDDRAPVESLTNAIVIRYLLQGE